MTGTVPPTFGQANLLNAFRRLPLEHQSERNFVRIWQVPPGVSPRRVHEAIHLLVERHESLRTRFLDHHNRWWQVVDPTTDPPVEDRRAAGDADDTRELLAELAGRSFDLRRQHAWHGVVLAGAPGAPHHLGLCLHHALADRYGLDQFERDFFALIEAGGHARCEVLGRPRLRPSRLAWEQHSAQWRDRRRRSIQHWARVLDELAEVDQLPVPGEPTTGRIDLGLRSASMARALHAAAGRCRVSAQSMLLVLTAVVVATVTGRNTPVLSLTVANRSDRRWRAIVAVMAQAMLLPIPLDPVRQELGDLARTVHQRALRCMRHGTFDPDELAALYVRRGMSPPAADCQFNQLPLATAGGIQLPADQVVGLVPRYQTGPRLRLWAFVGSELLIVLRADPRLVPEPAARRTLEWFRAELTRAAEGPSPVREMLSRLSR